jgi:hypothetical protein
MSWFTSIGGRKFILIIIAMVLMALKSVLQIDETTLNNILYLALGGAGAIAIEDAVGKLQTNAGAKK